MGWFWTIVVQLYKLAGPLMKLAYPIYASVQAIESPSREDDAQWLTYWVLYELISLVELAFDRVLDWIPFWHTLKLVAICWLVLPQFHGAAFVYENYVKKYASRGSQGLGFRVPKVRQFFEKMTPQARASVKTEYGTGAFEGTRDVEPPSPASGYGRSPVQPAQPTKYPGLARPGAGRYS